MFVGSLSLSMEYLLSLLSGKDMRFSLNWMVFPFLILLDFCLNPSRYFKPKVLKWAALLALPLIIFYISGNDANVPEEMSRFSLVKAGLNAVLIFSFYMLNSETSQNRKMIIYGLLLGATFGIILQFTAIFSILPEGAISTIKGLYVDVLRLGRLGGDPNQSVIYVLSTGAFISYIYYTNKIRNQMLLAYILSIVLILFVASTGSRSGQIVTVCMLFLSFSLSWSNIPKNSKRKIVFLIFILIASLFILSAISTTKFIKTGLISRWQYSMEYADDSISHRIMMYKWLFSKLLSGVQLVGFGYGRYYQEIGHSLPGGAFAIRWPHNSFPDAFIIGGLPFFVLYLLVWIIAFTNLWKIYKNGQGEIKGESSFFFILLVGLFIFSCSLSIVWIKITWAILGVGFGFLLLKEPIDEKKSELKNGKDQLKVDNL